ncbi:SCO2400 family protein [Streptomyces sp. NPDC000878]
MDYCSTCRRHLNGALVCPGCGAYAPDIAPLAVGTRTPYAATGGAERQASAAPWNEVDPGAEELGRAPQEQPYDGSDVDVPAPAPVGRAARRRQRERWKKTQRRALVATAVALVGGGMTVSSLNRQSTDRTQAATAPDREVMGIAEEQATEPVPISSTPTDTTYRAGRVSPVATGSSTANAPHEQSAVTPRATPTAPTAVQQDSVKVPLTAATTSAVSQTASTVSGATDTVTETTASPTPSATDSSSTSDTDTSATPSPSESSSSSSDSSSSSEICLLGLLCIS